MKAGGFLLNVGILGVAWALVSAPIAVYGGSMPYDITASSYIGGSGDNDSMRGCAIQSDGTIVLAANIGDADPSGVTPILFNGATNSSAGAIVRLSYDGTSVLSVTRLADVVLDLTVDDSDNIYVALWKREMAKLNPSATSIIWSKMDLDFKRIDVGPLG